MGTRLNAIREACRLTPDERSEDNINDVLEFVRDVKFFAKLTNLQQKSLCKTMTIESFDPRQNIFEVGDVGDKYYIILTGSVSVQVPVPNTPCPNGIHTVRCDCKNRPLETTVFLAKGSGFGELALQSDQPRSATIFTGEKTEVLVITRDDYEMYVGALWEGVVRHGLAVSLHKIAVFLADVGSMGQQLFLPGSSNTWKVSRIRSCTSVFNA
ncbi:Rapgef4 [Symbiodinium natans]|uniref:Rapgef4 protein n=1 Tax=Symbiodinium natans TaxID=878477 RepID=A0A812J6M7_9DINO|nr:Rapgef4 [Symbiodinium natans]